MSATEQDQAVLNAMLIQRAIKRANATASKLIDRNPELMECAVTNKHWPEEKIRRAEAIYEKGRKK